MSQLIRRILWALVVVIPFALVAGAEAAEDVRVFGCAAGAVDVSVDPAPLMHFVRLQKPPALAAPLMARYSFEFAKGPLKSVVVHV